MAKRILSMVLSLALLLTCVSGLTLIASAASVVGAFDATQVNADYVGVKDGFTVIKWDKGQKGEANFGSMISDAMGLTEATVADLTISLDYYYAKAENETNDWGRFGTWPSADKSYDDYFFPITGSLTTVDAWAEYTVTREKQTLKSGEKDLWLSTDNWNANSALYIRGIKVVAAVGEDTYTALWGSYTRAAIDFSTGEAVGTNAAMDSSVDGKLKKIEDLDVSGVDMVEHNQNFIFKVDGIGVTDAAAVTVEYYIPTTEEMNDNTRIGVKINNKDYTLRKGATSSNVNSDNLATDKLAACTFVVSGEDAQVLTGGTNVQITSWTVGEGTARHLYIKSVSVMPASSLAAPANPGYGYYDFTATYAPNPYYPAYTEADAYGVVAVSGDNGGQMYFKTTGLDSQSKVCLKFYLADGSDATDLSIDYQNTTEGGWKGSNGHVATFEDGVATYVLTDAIFQNGLNGLGSFRMNSNNAAKIRRVEIYTPSDKTALQEAINNKITDFTGKTSVSKAAYERLVAQAEALVNDEFALQADVDAAATLLANASLKDVVQIAKEDTTVSYKEYTVLGNCRDEDENIGFTNVGSYIEFEVNVLEACWYTIKTSAANGNGSAFHQELKDGDTVIGTAEVGPTGSWQTYTDIELGTVYLQPGLRTLRLTFTDGGSNFKALVFAADADRPAPADKTALDAAVKAADALILSNYTAESVEALKQALTAAKEVLANADATQEQADAAVAALNAATAALVDIRYTLSNATVSGLTADNGTIELIEVNGEYVYAWRFLSEAGKYIGIGDAADVLKDSTSVKYEYDIMFDTSNLNDRCFLMFGTTSGWKGVNDKQDDPYFNGFAAHGSWKPTPAVGTWGTITLENAEFDSTQLDSGCVTRLGNWVTNGYLYVRAIRAIDSTDPTKVISLTFNKAPMDAATEEDLTALRNAVENPVSTEGKTTFSKAAYEAALEAGRALLAEESPLKVKVEKALKEIQNAAAALTDVLTISTTETTTISAANAIVTGNGSYSAGDDCIGNTGGGTVITFEINVPEARIFDLDIMAYTGAGKSTVKLGDGMSEDVYGSFDVEGSTWGPDQWPEQPYHFEVALEAGVQVITLTLTNPINLRSIALTAQPSILVFETDGLRTDHNGVNSMEFADRWAAFDLGVAEGVYNMKVTVCYASTGEPWWQIQLSDKDGNRYTEGGKYSENEGFQQKADWLTNSNDEWKLGTVTFTDAKLGADDAWKSGFFNGTSFDFGFHICGGDPANLYIRGVKFEVTDSTGNTITKQWGSLIEEQPIEVDKTALEAAIASAAALDLTAYKEESAQALTAALEAARAVLANEEAMQEEIDAAVKALNDVVAAMEMDSWDLIVESVTTTAGLNVKKGESVKFVAVIKNIGTKTIPEGSKFGMAIAIDGATVGWSDNYKTTDKAPALAPGETLTLTTCGGGANGDGTWTAEEAGEYTLRAFVNDNEADGIKNEMSRDNNTLEVTLKVSEDGLSVTTLNETIAKAEELDLTQYTEASAKTVTDALAAAKAVLANADATQADVDKAAADLTAAIAALVKTGVTLGDVNGDNKIDTADAVLVLQYAAELIGDADLNKAAADVNGDGVIDTADAVLILQYVAELIQEFPTAK